MHRRRPGHRRGVRAPLKPLDVAVVGGGLAGLAAAWRLSARHRVTLYERHAGPGFTASSVTLPAEFGGLRVDVPLRVFYPGYYPTLLALYAELGVATAPVDYATTFCGLDREPFFRYRNLRWRDASWGYVLPQDIARRHARRVLAGALHFHRAAPRALRSGALAGLTLAQHLQQARYATEFVEGLLLPAVATVCTCPRSAALEFPAEVVVDYLVRGLTRQAVRRAVDGADDVAARLLRPVAARRFGARLIRLQRQRGGPVSLLHADGSRTEHDHVVLATPAHRALQLLAEPTAAEAELLGAIEHHPVEVLVHRDEAVMPRRRRHWSPVNALVAAELAQPATTIWVNAVQPALREAPPLFQTVAPAEGCRPAAARVLGSALFERPVVTLRSQRLLPRLPELHAEPGRQVWFCGSFAQPGIPLLEAAVASALAVAQRIDAVAGATPAAGGPHPVTAPTAG